MKKIALALLVTVFTLPASAAWELVWNVQNGGVIRVETSTIQYGNGYIQAHMHTDYTSAINSDTVCYPSGADCQYKKLGEYVIYQFNCANIVRVVLDKNEWDSGPTSENYDPRRSGYNIPEQRPLVAPPQTDAPEGSVYDITNIPSLRAVQSRVCGK